MEHDCEIMGEGEGGARELLGVVGCAVAGACSMPVLDCLYAPQSVSFAFFARRSLLLALGGDLFTLHHLVPCTLYCVVRLEKNLFRVPCILPPIEAASEVVIVAGIGTSSSSAN